MQSTNENSKADQEDCEDIVISEEEIQKMASFVKVPAAAIEFLVQNELLQTLARKKEKASTKASQAAAASASPTKKKSALEGIDIC